MRIKILVFAVLINFRLSFSQTLSCSYSTHSSYGYTCNLSIQNPNGLNNFTSIGGTHLSGKTNNNVLYIIRSSGSTTNVPSIICDKFQSATRVEFGSFGIQTVDQKSFKNCKKLKQLTLASNKISKMDENAFIENLELEYITLNVNQLSEVPEFLFKNQHKLTELRLCSSPLPDIPKNFFNSLEKLTILHLESNKLKDLRVEWFLPLINLQTIYLEFNLIEELPRNIFMSLNKLATLTLHNNKLTVVRSDSFRGASNLKTINFQSNQINAIDEKFIDNTGVQTLHMGSNLCAKQSITDTSIPRTTMRLALQNCFKNFDDLLLARIRRLEEAEISFNDKISEVKGQNQQLTSNVNDLNSKVINITAENDKIRSEMQNITKENEEMRADLENQIEELVKENEDQNTLIKDQALEFQQFRNETEDSFKNLLQVVQDLENELLVWTTRPCSCR